MRARLPSLLLALALASNPLAWAWAVLAVVRHGSLMIAHHPRAKQRERLRAWRARQAQQQLSSSYRADWYCWGLSSPSAS